jgi:WD40 repeat protein
MVASNDLGQIRIWDTHSAALIASPQDRDGELSEMAFSPDGRLLLITAFSEFQSVFIDPSTGKIVGEPLRQANQVNDAEFSHDGKRIATVCVDGTLRVWDATTRSQIGVATGIWAFVVQFNRDDNQILATTGTDLQIFDTNTCTLITGPLSGGSGYVKGSALSSGGSRAAAVNDDGEVNVWGTKSGHILIEPLLLKARLALGARFRDSSIAFDASDGVVTCQVGTDELSAWSVPPSSSGQKVPNWLLRLGTAVAGGTLDEKSVFHPNSPSQDDLATVRLEMQGLPANSPYIEWGRWFLTDRATRSIAPGLSIMPEDAERTLPYSETK